MEGLKFGWKKSVKRYHHYREGDIHSLCGNANYTLSPFKELIFLTEDEITLDMKVCSTCYNSRKNDIKHQIKKRFQETIRGQWDDLRICPNCKTKIIFWNTRSKSEHLCTVCDTMVNLA